MWKYTCSVGEKNAYKLQYNESELQVFGVNF